MPSVTKMKVVPPSILMGSRGWCVSTKVGAWYGGLSPHQPFQFSSGQGPRIGPNMFRPRMKAPNPSIERRAYSSSIPSEPPSLPVMARKVRVSRNHRCNSIPRLPRGFSRLCPGPAPNPSSEIEKPATRTRVMTPSTACDHDRSGLPDLHRNAERQFGHADGAARVRAGLLAPQLQDQVGEAVDHRRLPDETRRGVDHAERAYPVRDAIQVAELPLQAAEHGQRGEPRGFVTLLHRE